MLSKITSTILHKPARKTGDKPDPNAQEMKIFPHDKTFTNVPDVDAIITSFLSPEERLNIRFVGQKIKQNLDESHPRKAMQVSLSPYFEGKRIPHHFFAITLDGTQIISALCGEKTNVWSMKTGNLIHKFKLHPFNFAAITPDGTKLVTNSPHAGIMEILDIETGNLILNIQGHANVRIITVTPDGNKIITCHDGDAIARIWDMKTGALIRELRGHARSVVSIAVTPDSTKIATASYDRTAKFWDIETGNLIHTLEGHTSEINSTAITPDGTKIVTASYDRTAKIWDIETGNLIHTLEGHAYTIEAVAITPDGTKIVTASSVYGGATLGIWDIKTGNCLGDFQLKLHRILTNLAITSDGKKIVIGSRDERILVLNFKEWTLGDETKFNKTLSPDHPISITT